MVVNFSIGIHTRYRDAYRVLQEELPKSTVRSVDWDFQNKMIRISRTEKPVSQYGFH